MIGQMVAPENMAYSEKLKLMYIYMKIKPCIFPISTESFFLHLHLCTVSALPTKNLFCLLRQERFFVVEYLLSKG